MMSVRLMNRRTVRLALLIVAAGAIVLTVFLVKQAGPSSATAADHLDAPGATPPGGDVQTDITDVYAFQSPTHRKRTVLALNVNGVASPGEAAPGPDRPFAQAIPLVKTSSPVTYNLHVDNNGDAVTDVNIRIAFGRPSANGSQPMNVEFEGSNGKKKIDEEIEGRSTPFGAAPVVLHDEGIRAFAGRRDDPFFFDLLGFLNITKGLDAFKLDNDPTNNAESFVGCTGSRSNFFARRNVSSIVLEVPTRLLSARSGSIGVWGSTDMPGLQIDRMGRPAIATVFIPNNPLPPDRVVDGKASLKNTYNHSNPVNDPATFRGEVVDTLKVLFSLNDQGGPIGTDNPADDAGKISGLADFLLPDILTIDPSSSTGFPNGRQLTDDVIDTELGLISEGTVTEDCVANDSTFLARFPYLGDPN